MASPFSGKAGRLAAMWGVDQANASANRISDLLGAGQTNALEALKAGQAPALGALGAGYDTAKSEYQGAIDRFNPWADAGKGALGMYQNSLGLGGAAGNDTATAAFREAPGYKYSVDQATDAVARKASALGALGSGNTMQAISDRAQNMADQGYKGWQDQLNGLSNTGLAAVGQQAGLQGRLGDLGAQRGRDEAGIYTGDAARSADIYSNFARMGAANLGNLGQQTIDLGTAGFKAGDAAAQNKLNFGMQLGKTAASLLGGAMTGGLGFAAGGLLSGLGGNGLGKTPGAGGLY